MVVGESVLISENAQAGKGWTAAEEVSISLIMAEDGCARLQAIRKMRQKKNRHPVSAFGVFPDYG
jgi:hypothetical protein